MTQRVLITGLDIISSLGLDAGENWDKLVAGQSGIGPITTFDSSSLQTSIAALLPEGIDERVSERIKKRTARQMTRITRTALVCAQQAVEDSGINFEEVEPGRCGVIMGTVRAGDSSLEDDDSRHRIVKRMNNALPAWISIHFGLEGPAFAVTTACSSSAYAIGLGYDMIVSGKMDLMILGGADSVVNPEEIEGFNELYALSVNNEKPEEASCPFSADRDGFVIGEGAGILVLESEEHALRRGARVYAEMAGYALSSEAYNMMAPKRDGEGMARTMVMALEDSGLDPGDIDYINAHGTSTVLNDKFETMAVKTAFGSHANELAISSTKSMIGHTIGAAGGIEAAVTALAIHRGIIPPTINYHNPDPELDLDYVPNKARKKKINAALSNSFAFGGHNASIALQRYPTKGEGDA